MQHSPISHCSSMMIVVNPGLGIIIIIHQTWGIYSRKRWDIVDFLPFNGGSDIEEPFVNSNRGKYYLLLPEAPKLQTQRKWFFFTDGRLGQDSVRTSRGNPPYHPGDPSYNQEPGLGNLMIRNHESFVWSPFRSHSLFSSVEFLAMNKFHDSWETDRTQP